MTKRKKRPPFELQEREPAPIAVEFKIALAAFAYEKCLRRVEALKKAPASFSGSRDFAESQTLRAWKRLRRLTSSLMPK